MAECQPPMFANVPSSIHVAIGRVQNGRLGVEVLHRFWNGGTQTRGTLYWDVIGLWREILHGPKLVGARTAEATRRPLIAGPVDATLIVNLLVQLEAVIAPDSGRDLVRASNQLETYRPSVGQTGVIA